MTSSFPWYLDVDQEVSMDRGTLSSPVESVKLLSGLRHYISHSNQILEQQKWWMGQRFFYFQVWKFHRTWRSQWKIKKGTCPLWILQINQQVQNKSFIIHQPHMWYNKFNRFQTCPDTSPSVNHPSLHPSILPFIHQPIHLSIYPFPAAYLGLVPT